MLKKSLALLTIPLFFSSCISMAPKLELDTSNTIPENFKNYEQATKTENMTLDSFILDEKLKKVVDIALENNKDLQIAILRVEESKYLYRIEDSNLYPKIDIDGNLSREKKDQVIQNNYKAGIGTVFELDLFGKNKSLSEMAKNSFFSTQYALNSTKLALISQVINSYLSLFSNIENLNLQKKINENLESVCELTEKKFQAGAISKEDVFSSLAMLKEGENELLNYENLIEIDLNSLDLLLGYKLPHELLPNRFKEDYNYLLLVQSGIKSNILLNRPDIKELEYKLRAQNANIGAARANFFPNISLTANSGFASSSLSHLFSSSNSFWALGPNINIPIFTAGENMARLDLSHTQKDIALKEYEKGIQTAFKEVNDALVIRKNIYLKLQNQKELTKALKEAYHIALNSYKIGYGSYLNMLIEQKTYINSQKTLVKTYLEELENRVEIFKTLGGSFDK